jgi:hypothetical protein
MSNQDMNVSPKTDWWNNGRDVVSELNRLMAVRRAALDRMGESTIKKGAPLATIEEALVPVYLYHRWAVQSAASVIGGQDYIYSIRGDGREPFTRPSSERQRASIEALTATLAPSELAVPKAVIDKLPPRPMGFGAHRELFPRNTGSAFDVLAPAAVASDITIGFVLEPDRAARVVGQNAIDPTLPGLEEVIDRLTDATFEGTAANRYEEEILRTTQRVLTNRLMWLAGRAPLAQVRAISLLRLEMLQKQLANASVKDEAERAHRLLLSRDIRRFMERPSESIPPVYTPVAPPGAPIGGDMGMDWLAPVVWDCMLQDK